MTCPYTFPHRSRLAMIDYLTSHHSYVPMNTRNGGFCLAWNIKCNFNLDTSGTSDEHNPAFNDAWNEHVGNDREGYLFNQACENGLRQYLDKEWTNYPGIEQGEWEFATNGRSGGHLILTDAPSWACLPFGWASCRATWSSRGDFTEWLEALPYITLRRFYKAIRVLDVDLSRDAIRKEMAYQFSFLRQLWEEEQDAELEQEAATLTASRPDMYEPV